MVDAQRSLSKNECCLFSRSRQKTRTCVITFTMRIIYFITRLLVRLDLTAGTKLKLCLSLNHNQDLALLTNGLMFLLIKYKEIRDCQQTKIWPSTDNRKCDLYLKAHQLQIKCTAVWFVVLMFDFQFSVSLSVSELGH